MGKKKYFIFNKDTDYKSGYLDNVVSDDNGISIFNNHTLYQQEDAIGEKIGNLKEEKLLHTQNYGSFISGLLDSGELGTTWHRMTIDSDFENQVAVKIYIYASDTNTLEYADEVVSIEDIILSHEIHTIDKKDIFSPFLQKTIINSMDMLLHEVEGRYLWMIVEMRRRDNGFFKLNNFKIYFPKDTWIRYLPEVYSEGIGKNAFLERYLGLFQSLYEDLNTKIKGSVAKLDPRSTSQECLRMLSEWFSIDNVNIWNEDQLRYILENASKLYGSRGTKRGISEFIKIYTGVEPMIIEHQDFDKFKDDSQKYELYCSLYKNDPYIFTVLIGEDYIPSNKEYKIISKIIDDVKPANMEFDLVVLKPYIFLNNYTYMGINTVLGKYKSLSLDGFSLVPFSTLKDEN